MKHPFNAVICCVMGRNCLITTGCHSIEMPCVQVIAYVLLKRGKQRRSDRLRSSQRWEKNSVNGRRHKKGREQKTGCNALHQTQGMFPVGSIPTVHWVRMPEVSKRWVHLYLMNSLSLLALITIRCRQSLLENTPRTRPPPIYHSPCDVLGRSPVVSAIFHERYVPASPPAYRSVGAAGHRSRGNSFKGMCLSVKWIHGKPLNSTFVSYKMAPWRHLVLHCIK